MITAEDFVLELNDIEESKNFKLATVIDLFENKTGKVQFDGEDTPSEKQYAYLASYTPKKLDRVMLATVGGTYIILGKVNYNISPSTEEELDRYLFDLKLVTMQRGLNVTGNSVFNNALNIIGLASLNGGASVVGNVGVNGVVTAVSVSATGAITASGQLTGGSIQTNGALGAGATTLSSLTINGTLSHKGSQLGFYNTTPTNKKSVGRYVSSSPTVAGLYGKLDELIVALQNYGLIN